MKKGSGYEIVSTEADKNLRSTVGQIAKASGVSYHKASQAFQLCESMIVAPDSPLLTIITPLRGVIVVVGAGKNLVIAGVRVSAQAARNLFRSKTQRWERLA
jgi:hypothetical protein